MAAEIVEVRSGCTIYHGTREELIAAGLATPDLFPELPKRKHWDSDTDVSVQRIKGGRFELITRPRLGERTPEQEALYRFPGVVRVIYGGLADQHPANRMGGAIYG